MAEWSNAPVLKTGVLRGIGGSNPSLSAQSPVNRKIYRTFSFVFLSSPPSPSENGGSPDKPRGILITTS